MVLSSALRWDSIFYNTAPLKECDMKTDAQLKEDVTKELEWDPSINASQVGVAVKNGVVTLTRHLDNYAQKYNIEKVVGRVACVKAIALELDVKLETGHKRSDTEIAEAAESALLWNSQVPNDRIQVMVEKGWITLTGNVDWEYQRKGAENAVRDSLGVTGVSNIISLKPTAAPGKVADRIRDALTRHAESEAERIKVLVQGTLVTLRGEVASWPERAAASVAAWSAPGIAGVVNEIKVRG
jgi:osmotically-inducible protein OsmY